MQSARLITTAMFMLNTGICAAQTALKPQEMVISPDLEVVIYNHKDHPKLYLDPAPVNKENKAHPGSGDSFVFNGPLFEANGRPVGGFITRRPEIKGQAPSAKAPYIIQNVKDPASGGGNFANNSVIFGQKMNGEFFMIPYSPDINMSDMQDSVDYAVQNPAIVQNGKSLCNSNSTNFKTRIGMGFTKEGDLVVIDSQQGITFDGLAQEFIKRGVTNAIYLDGAQTGSTYNMQQRGNIPQGAWRNHVQATP